MCHWLAKSFYYFYFLLILAGICSVKCKYFFFSPNIHGKNGGERSMPVGLLTDALFQPDHVVGALNMC